MALVLLLSRLSVYLCVVLSAPTLAAAGHVRGNHDQPELLSADAADGFHLAMIDSSTTPQHDAGDSRDLLVAVCRVYTYNRISLGTPSCAPGQEVLNGYCYDACPSGYFRYGNDCYQRCVQGPWRDIDVATCENILRPILRNPFVPNSASPTSALTQCQNYYQQGCETINGALYGLCPPGYTSQGSSCIPPVVDCVASGYKSSSTLSPYACVRKVIVGGPGTRPACPPLSQDAYDSNCFAPCSSGYEIIGYTGCITTIPSGFKRCPDGRFAAQDTSVCSMLPTDPASCASTNPTFVSINCSCVKPFASGRYTCADGTNTTCSTGACVATTPWERDSNTNFCGATYCSCDTPNTGASGHNRFTCSDGYAAYCTSTTACTATTPWVKGSNTNFCGVTCSCDTPNTGAAGHNRFTCTDGYAAYCTSTSACVATTPWLKGSNTNFCGVTCSCDTPNTGASGHNRFTCTDGYAAYCTSTTACVATTPWLKNSNTNFCGVTCSCDTPNTGTAGHNRFTCTDGYAAYCTSTTACTRTTPWLKGSNTIFCG